MLRALLGLLAGLIVAALAAYLLGVKPEQFVVTLRGVSPWTIVGCVASAFVVIGLQALRWNLVMKPLLGFRYVQSVKAQLVGTLLNAFLPARGGDLIKVQYVGRVSGKRRTTILGTELVDRWLDWWGWFPILLVLSIVETLPRWLYTALGLFSAFHIAWASVLTALSRRGYVPRPGSRFGEVFDSFRVGVQAFRSVRTLAIAFLVSPLSWFWECIVLSLLGRAFDFDLTLGKAFGVLIAFNLAMVVPSLGAIGTFEAGGAAALVYFGMDQSQALAYMFVYHFTQLIPGVAAGAAVIVGEGGHLFRKSTEP
jgi:glycosyltransferase 2 family protein